MHDFPRGRKRRDNPAEVVAELTRAFPNDRAKQLRVFEAAVIGETALMTAVIARVFDDLTAPPPK